MSHRIESPNAVQKAFKRSKERESLIRRYNTLCECGHKSGRHWYAVEHGTASYDCSCIPLFNSLVTGIDRGHTKEVLWKCTIASVACPHVNVK